MNAYIKELQLEVRELQEAVRLTNQLLKDSKSTRTYIHQFGVWGLGLLAIVGFYYNYVLMQPIWWTLFAVFFSYVVLLPCKSAVIGGILWLLDGKRASEGSLSPTAAATSKRIIMNLILPRSQSASRVYFGVLVRLCVIFVYTDRILPLFPDLHSTMLWTVSILAGLAVALHFIRRSVPHGVRVITRNLLNSVRSYLAGLLVPNVHLISTILVIILAAIVMLGLCFWVAHGVTEEFVFLYGSLSTHGKTAHRYIRGLSTHTDRVKTWVGAFFASDLFSGKAREIIDYLSFLMQERERQANRRNSKASRNAPFGGFFGLWSTVGDPHTSSDLVVGLDELLIDSPAEKVLLSAQEHIELCSRLVTPSGICEDSAWQKHQELFKKMGNVTEIFLRTLVGDVESITTQPRRIVYGLGEILDFFGEEERKGSPHYSDILKLTQGGLSNAAWIVKDLLFHGGQLSFAAISNFAALGKYVLLLLFDSLLQAAVFITTLFLLLQSRVGLDTYSAVLLHFFDPSNELYQAVHAAVRAILYSAVKMAVFHGIYAWLFFAFFDFRVTCLPTVAAFVLGLLPVISPVFVVWLVIPPWLYLEGKTALAGLTCTINFFVWWFVGPAIYAEIPDSSPWMTTFAVGFGISLFGPRGVILGPAIAVVPFAIYRLGVRSLQKSKRERLSLSEKERSPSRRTSLDSVPESPIRMTKASRSSSEAQSPGSSSSAGLRDLLRMRQGNPVLDSNGEYAD